MDNNNSLSVIVPVFNEQDKLKPLYLELTQILKNLDLAYEVIFIDDGSTDLSFQELSTIHAVDPSVKVIQFRRNFGQTAAFASGFDAARGDLILTIDADGQNDPNDISKMLTIMQDGNYDFITGWRVNRKEPYFRRLFSRTANWIISRSTHLEIHDRGCSLKLFKREIVKNIRLYGKLHRFLPELASAYGVKIAEIPVNDRVRKSGKSKYGSITRPP